MKGKKTSKKLLIFFSIFIFCTLLVIAIWIAVEAFQEQKIANSKKQIPYIAKEANDEIETKIENKIQEETKQEETQKENMIIEKYKGYEVEAKLEIPSIQLETYVIKPYSKQALNVSVTKFWGANANQVGNFCIAGHNFQNNIMFHNLKKVKVGDMIYITDQQNEKISYRIYNMYTVLPKDVSCLSQQTNGKKEVTLITCTFDSKKRIIVKARDI